MCLRLQRSRKKRFCYIKCIWCAKRVKNSTSKECWHILSQLSEGACEILWDEIHALHMDSTGISWTYSNFMRQPSDSQNVLAVTNVSRFCLVFPFFFYLVISFLSNSVFPCSPLLSDSLTWLPFRSYNGYKLAGKLSAISWHPRFVVISDFSPWRLREYKNTEHNSLSNSIWGWEGSQKDSERK